jgi:hypothetical protein
MAAAIFIPGVLIVLLRSALLCVHSFYKCSGFGVVLNPALDICTHHRRHLIPINTAEFRLGATVALRLHPERRECRKRDIGVVDRVATKDLGAPIG